MVTLQDVVQAVLADLTNAQDNTNKLTRALANEYQTDSILQYLPIPNALLDEVQCSLRFAIEDAAVTACNAPPSGTTPSTSRLRAVARAVAQHITDGLTDQLHSLQPDTEEGVMRRQNLADSLAAPNTLRGVGNHVVAVLERAFRNRPTAPAEATSWIEGILEELKSRLTALFVAEKPFVEAVKDVNKAIDTVIDQRKIPIANAIHESDRSVSLLEGGRLQQLLTTNVVVDSKTLSGLPEQAVHNLHLKMRLRNYRWVIVSATEEPQLVPETT